MADASASAISPEGLLRQAFDAYNRQDADALLAMVSDDVSWATDRAPLHGKHALRRYWDHQWQHTKTHDHVVQVTHLSDGRYAAVLEQAVRSIDGNLLFEGRFEYAFSLKNGLIEQLFEKEVSNE